MRRRRLRSNRRSLYISSVILLFILISIGYSTLTRTLNITGNIAVTKVEWDVHFENARKIDGNIDLTSGFSYPGGGTSVSLGLALNEPGQFFEFEMDVVNSGGIDAMLGSTILDEDGVLSLNGRSNYLEYSVTYDDGIPLTAKDRLTKGGGKDKLKVRIAFKEDVEETDLPSSSDDNFTVTFKATYVQDDGTSRERERGTGADMLIRKANAKDKNYAGENAVSDEQKKEMFAFYYNSPTEKTDYRYIGKQGTDGPNNYIDFNCAEVEGTMTCEEWRIIGVFDGKIKIMRKDRIEDSNLRWDYKQSGLGSSENNGSNDWSDAQLMYMLNKDNIDKVLTAKSNYTKTGNLIKDANGYVIYEIGKKPSSQANGKQNEYTGGDGATTWRGLSSEALGQVAEVTWNLGALTRSGDNTNNYTYGTPAEMYQAERGTTTCTTTGNCTKERPTTWTGKVGLMYPSDYGYTFDRGVNSPCYGNLYQCRTAGNTPRADGADPEASWLFESGYVQWTLSPSAGYSYSVMVVNLAGIVNDYVARNSLGVRPVVYLRSDIRLEGTGSSSDHYRVSAN